MDAMRLRPILLWILPAVAFALCWAWAIAFFGSTGLYAGWIAGAIAARLAAVLASLLWSLIALTMLLGWHFYASERGGPFGSGRAA